MLLTRIEASGFRNLEGFAEFGSGLNIFYGDNAQGKTNWLEAIYILGNTKSFRTRQIQLLIAEDSKQLFINGKREALGRYIGNLDVFVFSLEEMDVIRGEPGQRRRLDRKST